MTSLASRGLTSMPAAKRHREDGSVFLISMGFPRASRAVDMSGPKRLSAGNCLHGPTAREFGRTANADASAWRQTRRPVLLGR
jgi:hypothetical protein